MVTRKSPAPIRCFTISSSSTAVFFCLSTRRGPFSFRLEICSQQDSYAEYVPVTARFPVRPAATPCNPCHLPSHGIRFPRRPVSTSPQNLKTDQRRSLSHGRGIESAQATSASHEGQICKPKMSQFDAIQGGYCMRRDVQPHGEDAETAVYTFN